MVEGVLGLCGGMEEEAEGPGARTQKYIVGSVVDSFVYDASGLSVVASMSHYRDEAGWLTKAIPSLKTNEDVLLGDHWSIVESITSCHDGDGWCGWQVLFGVERHRIQSFTFGRAKLLAAAPNLYAMQPDSLIATGVKGWSFTIELIATRLGSAGLVAAGCLG